jgi:PadR family transcriptional regulator, regulatory protein PadR
MFRIPVIQFFLDNVQMGSKEPERLDLLQGTLEMMALRTLLLGPANGYQIARTIEQMSDDILDIDHGSLYPALHRLEKRGWLSAKWEISDTNRRAKFYRLTPAGRKQLASEHSKWERLTGAIARVMRPA